MNQLHNTSTGAGQGRVHVHPPEPRARTSTASALAPRRRGTIYVTPLERCREHAARRDGRRTRSGLATLAHVGSVCPGGGGPRGLVVALWMRRGERVPVPGCPVAVVRSEAAGTVSSSHRTLFIAWAARVAAIGYYMPSVPLLIQ